MSSTIVAPARTAVEPRAAAVPAAVASRSDAVRTPVTRSYLTGRLTPDPYLTGRYQPTPYLSGRTTLFG